MLVRSRNEEITNEWLDFPQKSIILYENISTIWIKEDLHRKLGIFILPIVSDWTNVFILTWLSYAEKELTNSLALAPDWLTKC